MKRTRIEPMSIKMIAQRNAEVEVRKQLARRAGGLPVLRKVTICRHDGVFYYTAVRCIGGICERCHQHTDELEPHEKNHRSQGGVLSLENTDMLCRSCHRIEQRSSPELRWLK